MLLILPSDLRLNQWQWGLSNSFWKIGDICSFISQPHRTWNASRMPEFCGRFARKMRNRLPPWQTSRISAYGPPEPPLAGCTSVSGPHQEPCPGCILAGGPREPRAASCRCNPHLGRFGPPTSTPSLFSSESLEEVLSGLLSWYSNTSGQFAWKFCTLIKWLYGRETLDYEKIYCSQPSEKYQQSL